IDSFGFCPGNSRATLPGLMKKRVVFICVHNSARSQMAEAWLNTICGEYFEAQSAGLEPGSLHPLAVKVMAEAGIDISKKKTQAVFDVFVSGQLFAYVITVRDEASAEKMSYFPGPRDANALELPRSFRGA